MKATDRALVTGGAGFIGHHLVERLASAGIDVLVVDDMSTGRADRLAAAIRVEKADITVADLARYVASWEPRVVFHLAAQTSVDASMRDPLRDLQVNGVGTHRLVEAVRGRSVERLVFVSSGGAIYGDSPEPATELTLPQPRSYYGMHKLLAEGYVRASGVGFGIARPSNVYGPGQSAGSDGAVVASFVAAVGLGSPIRIDGDGEQSRDFVHVSDVVSALLLLAAHPESGLWNVASGESVSVNCLAALVDSSTGVASPRSFAPLRPGDVRNSRMTAMKLQKAGWRQQVSLDRGLRDLVDAQVEAGSHSAFAG